MMGIEFVKAGTQRPAAGLTSAIAKKAGQDGVLVLTCGTYGNVLRFLPPLSISNDLLREGLQVVANALQANA